MARDRIGIVAVSFLAAAALSGCTDPSEPPPPPPPPPSGLRIVAAPAATDTIDAMPLQALVVEFRDEEGSPVSGVVVRFTAANVTGAGFVTAGMNVGRINANFFEQFIADTTNARGTVAVLVQFGRAAVPAQIRVTAPEYGQELLFETTVRPGAPARLSSLPADTTLHPAGQFQLRAAVVDRWLNPRPDPVTYDVVGPPLVSPTSAGLVTAGNGFGSARVRVSGLGFSDTTLVRVVPRGTILAADASGSAGWVVIGLDGSGERTFPVGAAFNIGLADPAWLPDGSGFLYVAHQGFGSEFLVHQPLEGPVVPLIPTPVPLLGVQLSPDVSRDGRTVFFSGGNTDTGTRSIWRVGIDGTGARRLTNGPGDFFPSVERAGQVVAYHDHTSTIRFASAASGAEVGPTIPGLFPSYGATDLIALLRGESVGVVNVDGSGFRAVTQTGRRYAQLRPKWSPDARWLLLRGEQFLELVEVATGLTIPLPWSASLTHPAWKPGSE